MAVESLLRPQSAGSAILSDTGSIGTGQSGSTVKIFMKVVSSRFALSMGVLDTTGDGDSFAQVDHNNEYRGQISLNGFVLAGHHIGLAALQDDTDTTSGFVNPVTVKFTAGYGHTYNFKMTIRDVMIDWNRQAPVVGLAIVGMLTGNVTNGEAFGEVDPN
jgi:hypothetical protein